MDVEDGEKEKENKPGKRRISKLTSKRIMVTNLPTFIIPC